jgi:hypothetical protein
MIVCRQTDAITPPSAPWVWGPGTKRHDAPADVPIMFQFSGLGGVGKPHPCSTIWYGSAADPQQKVR